MSGEERRHPAAFPLDDRAIYDAYVAGRQSAALTVGAGLVAYWSKEKADEAYDRYLHSASAKRQNEFYAQARRYDRLAGTAFIGMEAGLVLSSYLLFFNR